jgi:riboflavin synthase
MFTGLIEKSGVVVANLNAGVANRLTICASFDQLQAGESIAVNGVCLTLLPDSEDQLIFDVSPETLKITTLGELSAGDYVNIERAMLATTRFGGHYVSGHVDTKAHLQSINPMDDYIEMTVGDFAIPADMYLLPKGSITLDGVSLTINEVANGSIKVMLVPHTLNVTTLGRLKAGQCVNVEFDYLTRIIAQQVSTILAN